VKDTVPWHVRIHVLRPGAADADRVAQALSPEVSREVPRARAELVRPDSRSLELRITATDTSACRAALNTYLGWIGLVLSTEQAADGSRSSSKNERRDPASRSA
jgi:tRNA threonylcarbamoyladenosine modification (KEOPS) complex  Pcc1 subunit